MMRISRIFILVLCLVLSVPALCETEGGGTERLLVNELLEFLNSEREARNLPLLAGSEELTRAASGHSHEMARLNYFSHRSPDPGRAKVQQRVEAEGLRADRLTQRIYSNFNLADDEIVSHCLSDWQSSIKFRGALFSPDVSHVGFGFARRGDEVFVTQIFAGGWVRPVAGVSQGELRFDTEGCKILAQRILDLSNEIRVKVGRAPLRSDQVLVKTAVGHSTEMLNLNYFGHYSPNTNRHRVRDRLKLEGSDPIMVAENLYQCTGYRPESVPRRAIRSWLESPGHRDNLLDQRCDFVGIGVVARGESVYITQVFSGTDEY